ncbi:MAG: hypothetical protein R3213_09425, partial [Flavobacteriaceae bacterium]|nr:hypothetical protein [Flavobacteriaceae bacterium]
MGIIIATFISKVKTLGGIKKFLKILAKIAGVLVLLFIILVLILSIPAVQSSLGRYATDRINSEFGTNINVEYVRLMLNGDVELKNVFIRDYKKDTLINVNSLSTSIYSFRNLTQGNLVFGDIVLDELTFNIKTHKGDSLTNLDVFINKFENDNPPSEQPFLMSSSDVSINDGIFRLIDENKETPNILEFKDLNLNATNFVINGPVVEARINTMQFIDRRGMRLNNLTTNFKFTPSSMDFKALKIRTQESNLDG